MKYANPFLTVVLFLTLSFSVESFSQETSNNEVDQIKRLIDLVSNQVISVKEENRELKKKVEALERSLNERRVSFFSKAIIAFDGHVCPAGWKNVGLEEADRFAGRTVIAAGPRVDRDKNGTTIARKYLDDGGEEKYSLSVDQLPKWERLLTFGHPTSTTNIVYRSEGNFLINRLDQKVWPGKGSTVNNMPPFLALTLCRWDQ